MATSIIYHLVTMLTVILGQPGNTLSASVRGWWQWCQSISTCHVIYHLLSRWFAVNYRILSSAGVAQEVESCPACYSAGPLWLSSCISLTKTTLENIFVCFWLNDLILWPNRINFYHKQHRRNLSQANLLFDQHLKSFFWKSNLILRHVWNIA